MKKNVQSTNKGKLGPVKVCNMESNLESCKDLKECKYGNLLIV